MTNENPQFLTPYTVFSIFYTADMGQGSLGRLDFGKTWKTSQILSFKEALGLNRTTFLQIYLPTQVLGKNSRTRVFQDQPNMPMWMTPNVLKAELIAFCSNLLLL
jgi:hypothetical protein